MEWERYEQRTSRNYYRRTTGSITAIIICSFFIFLLHLVGKVMIDDQSVQIFCIILMGILGIVVIACIITAIENYMWAKDAEWNEIIEKLEGINKGIADLNKKLEEP